MYFNLLIVHIKGRMHIVIEFALTINDWMTIFTPPIGNCVCEGNDGYEYRKFILFQ